MSYKEIPKLKREKKAKYAEALKKFSQMVVVQSNEVNHTCLD